MARSAPPLMAAREAQRDPSRPPARGVQAHATGKKFTQLYRVGKILGRGAHSTVYAAQAKDTGAEFAAKAIRKHDLDEFEKEKIEHEVALLRELGPHPGVCNLVDFFSETRYYVLVMPLVKGGELFDRIVEKSCYTEREAKQVVKSLLAIIQFLHRHDVAHRDVKPENILLKSKYDDTSIVLCDFGVAKRFAGNEMRTGCGSPHYIAPEILQGHEYGPKCDIWSLGVVTFTLLSGFLPFDSDFHSELFHQITSATFSFPLPEWGGVSSAAKDLISKMLVVAPDERHSATDLLSHEWFNDCEPGSMHDLSAALGPLKEYNIRRSKMRVPVLAVQAVNWLSRSTSLTRLPASMMVNQDAEEVGEDAGAVDFT